MEKVFVYGSLLSGLGNNGLLGESRLVGTGETIGEYRMISFGSFPALLPDGEVRERIRGEMYEVNADTLAKLDRLEGHPRFYRRWFEPIQLDDGTQEFAWVYILNETRVGADERSHIGNDWKQAKKVGA